MELAKRTCFPCNSDWPPLEGEALAELHKHLDKNWVVVEEHHLERTFLFTDFQNALDFVIRAGAIAEEAQHHPDLYLAWGKVRVLLWTHKIDGLHEADFILAARIEEAFG
ncbi:MAG: 4a-hydroxytetrahydrobiopterin dehydratase [Deltaproteobacteria bacterium]|nr:4a-hydroxytetrahydrobiopterin dehydratase [Deltaproteobacteria bacterium]